VAKYVYQYPSWPNLTWDSAALSPALGRLRHKQGILIGRLDAAGFSLRERMGLDSLTDEIRDSFKIEGESIDPVSVRSSIARKLSITLEGIDTGAHGDHFVEGVVDMMLDATTKSSEPLTLDRLFAWHATLFPSGYSGMKKVVVAAWRCEEMRIVSGPIGRERTHYVAPAPSCLPVEMDAFLNWLNTGEASQSVDPIIKAGVAHYRFIMIHPFDDGNGRLARAITEMLLTRADAGHLRYYSLSSRMLAERKDYYATLERTQYADSDITEWLTWYLGCLERAIEDSLLRVEGILLKADFWDHYRDEILNARQQRVLSMLLDGFEGKLTTKKWAAICKVSHDTALRDIKELIEKNVLVPEEASGRSTAYRIRDWPETHDS
jgi:Fic family protein